MRKLLAAIGFLLAVPAMPQMSAAQEFALKTVAVAEGLELPVLATAPPGDERLFIVEQTGRIRILVGGEVLPTPFLDLSGSVSDGNEQGLLGLAFHPGFAENGRFFVNYTNRDGDTRIVGYTVSADRDVADAGSATQVLAIDQPARNHNGGWLGFGPDGLLYVGMGDGGGSGDRRNNAQNPDSLLGKLLRIDVDAAQPYAIPEGNPFANGGGAPEVYMLGLRNPWRIDFDGDALYIADVGQNAYEEVTVLPHTEAGANLGWRIAEGPACFNPEEGCDTTGLVPPTVSYAHADGGCSITGGYVYRGAAMPDLHGHYFFADFCEGFVRSFKLPTTVTIDWTPQLGNLGNITSFGVDGQGELYILTIDGNLYRIERDQGT